MKAIFTLLATTAVAAATSLSGRTGQESAPVALPVASAPTTSQDLFGSVAPAPTLAQVPVSGDPGVYSPPIPVLASLFGAQYAPAAPPRGVPILEELPVLGRLFTQAEVQEPTPAPPATRGRRRAAGADDERAVELERLKARLAELEQQLAERERGETERVRTRDRSDEGNRKRIEEVRQEAGEQAKREWQRARAFNDAAADEATLDAERRAHQKALAEHGGHQAQLNELLEHARSEAKSAAERARIDARVVHEHARAQALDARALAEHTRQAAEETRAHAEGARAQADELRAQAERAVAGARRGARESLRGLGYVDTTPEGAAEGREWIRLEAPAAPRIARARVVRPDSQADKVHAEQPEVVDPRTPVARVRGRAPRPGSAAMPPGAPKRPVAPMPPTPPSAPHAATAPVAPMPGAPSMPGRAGTLRSLLPPTAAPAHPGAPSTPRAGSGAATGGAINIHVENGDVHIHNGGGGAQISVNGANPFSVDTTQPRGDKDRVSGAFAPEAENEKSSRTKGSKTFVRSFGVGDLRESFSGHAHRLTLAPTPYVQSGNWLAQGDAFKVDGDAFADVYYGLVDSDGAAMTWTPEQVAGVQQAYTAVLPEATADAVRAYSVYAPSAVWQPTASAASATSAPEGALEELLRLVREVHADVRALRTEMQTLRGEVEQAPDTIAKYLETLFMGF